MAVHFQPLKIKTIKKETPDCVSVSFDLNEEMKNEFTYREGQNVTIKKNINNEEVRRSYSICSAPYENELKIAIKKMDGGVFSVWANEDWKEGDELEVLPPTGKFIAHLSKDTQPGYLAIAAGSGITPIIAIIKHTLKTQPDSRFTLVFGNRNRSSIIFFDELEGIKNKYMDRFTFINVLSRERMDEAIFYGRIDEKKLEAFEKLVNYKKMAGIYICGPEQMIFLAKKFLENKGIDKNKIHFELFTIPAKPSTGKSKSVETQPIETGPVSNVTIRLDGRAFDFRLGYNSLSVLDAALQQGADLPFACKGGVCSTCRAKLLKGKVLMDANYALEPEEVEAGFILTCQSHPRTDELLVDFDVK